MRKLIPQRLIDSYVMNGYTHRGKRYNIIFRYTGKKQIDMHELEVGFHREGDTKSQTSLLYLPSVRDNGMLQKNKNLWYPVLIVVPPAKFYNYSPRDRKTVHYLESIISPSIFATTLSEFMPEITTDIPLHGTKLLTELSDGDAADFQDTRNWHAIGMEYALLELFNVKIVQDITRSTGNGWKGVNASVRALSALVKAFMKYHSGMDEDGVSHMENIYEEVDERMLRTLPVEDKKGVLAIHRSIKQVSLSGTTPIDFCSCSQSSPLESARIKDGVTIRKCRFVGKPTFPYAASRRSILGITSDDPHRVIVSKSISRALPLNKPDTPYAVTDVIIPVDSLSLPGVRMTHPMNFEDGIIVSKTFAAKAGAYKSYVDRFTVPKGSQIEIYKHAFKDNEVGNAMFSLYGSARELARQIKQHENTQFIADGHEIIARIENKIPAHEASRLPEDRIRKETDEEGNITGYYKVSEIRTKAPARALITNVECFEPIDDISSDVITYRICSVAYLSLQVGDKLADAHGNKGTVSEILPDNKMPVWSDSIGNEIRSHYIVTPYCGKRLAIGGEIEDKAALLSYFSQDNLNEVEAEMYDSTEPISLGDMTSLMEQEEVEYLGTVKHGRRKHTGIPISLRTMYRLDNNSRESIAVRETVIHGEDRRITRNVKLGLDIVTMISRGCLNLVHDIMGASKTGEYLEKQVIPRLYAVKGKLPKGAQTYDLTTKLPREILGGPINWDTLMALDKKGTVLDDENMEKYGIVTYGEDTIVLPPRMGYADAGVGLVQITRIASDVNRVVAEIESERKGYDNARNIHSSINRYQFQLASSLKGKNGILRSTLFPVFPTTIRAVVSPYIPKSPEAMTEIALPRKAFKRLFDTNEDFKRLYATNQRCIIKRDPVHWGDSLFAVTFTIWDNDTIGVPPWLIPVLSGDFDGDCVVAMFPTTDAALADLDKMVPDLKKSFEPGKQLYNATHDTIRETMITNTGMGSSFLNLHESDVVKNQNLMDKLIDGAAYAVVADEAISAALDFNMVKSGTALTGALGLKFIFTREIQDFHNIEQAMVLYHLIAQNTLDAKAGTDVPAINVVEGFRRNRPSQIKAGLDSLGFVHEETINQLVLLAEQNDNTDKDSFRYLRLYHPVLACLQRNASVKEVERLAELVTNRKFTGNGIWEKLFDTLHICSRSGERAWFDTANEFRDVLQLSGTK